MEMGSIIKNRRKSLGITQEEMASRLGVTAPAVNKWERGNALPDVALLAPVARLLGITTDELLSFRHELTSAEIDRFLAQLHTELAEKSFREVFLSAKKKIEEYPNCESLIWQAAVMLDAKRMEAEGPDSERCEEAIVGWYERCLRSDSGQIRQQAADLLFHAFFRKGDYEAAGRYLEYFSPDNPERKRKQALVDSKTGKRGEAYRAYEELIFAAYQHIQLALNDLRILYMEDSDHEMAKKLARVSSSAASAFEMGRYHEVSAALDVAVWQKDAAWTAQVVQDILDSVNTIGDFTKSSLYRHMALKEAAPGFADRLKRELLQSLDDESFSYMRGHERWEKLKTTG